MNDVFGLSISDIDVIIGILEAYPEINEVIIFGSRAKETYKKGSDIDIALKGMKLEPIVSQIAGKLNEETTLPYYFDVVDYESIGSSNLKDHIDRVGIVLYKTE